jgi:hypothetical protein
MKKKIILIVLIALPSLLLITYKTNKTTVAETPVPSFHSWAPTPPIGWNSLDTWWVDQCEQDLGTALNLRRKSNFAIDNGIDYFNPNVLLIYFNII